MDHAEEQSMELEALEAIFMDDFVRMSDTSCQIFVQPFSTDDDEESCGMLIRSALSSADFAKLLLI
jgi:hypothetical protein